MEASFKLVSFALNLVKIIKNDKIKIIDYYTRTC